MSFLYHIRTNYPCFKCLRPKAQFYCISKKFNTNMVNEQNAIQIGFDDGFFSLKTNERAIVVSYWTPVNQLLRYLTKNDDHLNYTVSDYKDQNHIDTKISIGSALSHSKDILIKSKNCENKIIRLSCEQAMPDLIKWKIAQKLDHHLTLEELEQQKSLLLTSYFPLLENFENILRRSQSSRRLRFSWIALAGMSAQLGCLGRLIWFEYSWDIMEPITYCLGPVTIIFGLSYYIMTSQEYTLPLAEKRMTLNRFNKLSKKQSFDIEQFKSLHEQIKILDEKIAVIQSRHSSSTASS